MLQTDVIVFEQPPALKQSEGEGDMIRHRCDFIDDQPPVGF